jgi:hypothetical protein
MDEEDGKHLAEILRVLSETGPWAARINAEASPLGPDPRSPLGGDDTSTHPYDLSHAVWRHLSNAVDHLSCLRAVLGDAKVIQMYAPFTLVRGALENACGAVWLLQPPQRKERLTRRFRQAIADIRYEEQARELMQQPDARAVQRRIAEVRAIADSAGLVGSALKGNVSYSEIVQTVDEDGPSGNLVLLTWKTCSGFAHGDWWTTKNASQRTEIPDATREGIGTFKIEANLSLLMNMAAIAVLATKRGWQLYDQRCMSPYYRPGARMTADVPEAFRRSPRTRA